MKRIAALTVLVLTWTSAAWPCSPSDGGPMPDLYRGLIAKDRTAYTMSRAWRNKVLRVKREREAYLASLPANARGRQLPEQYRVTGTVRVPVLLGSFSNVVASYTRTQLDDRIFGAGAGTPGNVTDYWDEASLGNITMTGDVFDWVALPNTDIYYAGTNNGLSPSTDRVGEFMKAILDANDAAVDFGQYDNDGPDGIPNSGDDDGFVDAATFVHPESGAESGGVSDNIWSHKWRYSAWNASGGSPYTTNDAAAGGGFIRVEDYTIQPARNGNGTLIDIGVFCHEFGHALGLPDLYDRNGNGQGIGYWGIMGSGNWNTPTSPAHPCAWTLVEMGWVVPNEVTWQGAVESISQLGGVFKLPFTQDRFRRSTACAINGTYSLYCGLTQTEASTRGYVSAAPQGAYGNMWEETIEREFAFDGSTPVTLSYAYDYDTEATYDFAYAIIETGGSETTLATYTGTGSGTANIDLTPHVSGLTPGATYAIKFRATSDLSYSDEDGNYPSTCGLIAIDDLSVTGGGETYVNDFESSINGWHQDPAENPATEFWLVENRQGVGYDANVPGPGLLITHIDQDVAHSVLINNGPSARGVVVEEANGDFDLNGSGSNRGEASDVYPGTSNNREFSAFSFPASSDNSGAVTQVEVSSISSSLPTMTAFMRAGDPAPTATGISPDNIDNDQLNVAITVSGTGLRHGATFKLVLSARDGEDIQASAVRWVDPTTVTGEFNVYSKTGGSWDLEVTNPDGQVATMSNAITINTIVATKLYASDVRVSEDMVTLRFELRGQEEGEFVRLFRGESVDGPFGNLTRDFQPSVDNIYEYVDDDVKPGKTYHYVLDSILPDGERQELYRGQATVPTRDIALEQNVPNPFNPTTTIRYFLPAEGNVALTIHDISGRVVTTLVNLRQSAGSHNVLWNGRNSRGESVATGIYLYRLKADNRVLTRKMILLK